MDLSGLRGMDLEAIGETVTRRVMVDMRNMIDVHPAKSHGFDDVRVGR